VANTILFRRGTASQWTTANPILGSGEPGFETDTSKFKIGNGTASWSELDYFSGGGGSASVDLSDYLTKASASAIYLEGVYQSSSPTDPIVGQIWIDSDDESNLYDISSYLQAATASTLYLPLSATLDDLSDVDVSTASAGQFLKFDGASWISASVSAGGGAEVAYTADPPESPQVGEIWVESDVDVSIQTYHAAYSSASPANPIVGDLWVDSDEDVTIIPNNIDGGTPTSIYIGISGLDAGGV
jgi:hypothetical protein